MAQCRLIVGDSAALSAGDTAIKTKIEGRGHTCNVLSDDSAENVSGQNFVVILPTVVGGTLSTKYHTAAIPVVAGNFGAAWNIFSTGGTFAGPGAQTTIEIMTDATTIDGGLAVGAHTVVTSADFFDYYNAPMAGGVTLVGQVPTLTGTAILWICPAGGAQTSGNAPALRIGLGLNDNANANLNANGNAIWDSILATVEAELAGVPAGQPTIKRGRGIPGMRLGGTSFGQGF